MPHFGTLFGLTEEATQVILCEMGLLKHLQKTDSYRIQKDGWESVGSLFKVEQLLELKSTSFSKVEHIYVRLGKVSLGVFPAKIWATFMKDKTSIIFPLAIGNRHSTAFVTN